MWTRDNHVGFVSTYEMCRDTKKKPGELKRMVISWILQKTGTFCEKIKINNNNNNNDISANVVN